ncbi:phage tail protein [Erythrobacter sp. EC-HK427]|uniref:phage tail protein n=1 Tax=Erythrobacter sp. EC-HK427 TaxID=2038396 RepID=UPI001257AE62|nr:phage tail protein [Erythrobacter sp. EC-HK427]VVT07265.1 Phage tail protein [Erythrobacter sp. EC-HK427]
MTSQLSPLQLMSLGMFVFGIDTATYNSLQRRRAWHHEKAERHGNRPAAQFIGPGEETIQLAGLLVPELGADPAAMSTLAEMADTGETYPLIDGAGRILGQYRITALDEDHRTIMAGGIPRQIDFTISLERGDDQQAEGAAQ